MQSYETTQNRASVVQEKILAALNADDPGRCKTNIARWKSMQMEINSDDPVNPNIAWKSQMHSWFSTILEGLVRCAQVS